MALSNNKKVKAKLDGDTLQIIFETIYESRFEFDIKDGDLAKLGEIKKIEFSNCLMVDMPEANCLYKVAPNFDFLQIHNSKLSRISAWDLQGFDRLLLLNLPHNDIDELPGDLFYHTPNLQNISISGNKVKVIGEKILDPLKNLKFFDLRDNPGINVCYHHKFKLGNRTYSTLAELKKAVMRCKPVQHVWNIVDEQKKEIDELKTTCNGHKKEIESQGKKIEALEMKLEEVKRAGTFHKFDFTVKINGKEFKVQKEILIANSPLLADLIRENQSADTLELKDISEESFEEILDFMVNKSQPKQTTNFIELYAASGRLQMKELMELCGRALMDKVIPENSLEIFNLCLEYPNMELQKKAYAEYGKILEK